MLGAPVRTRALILRTIKLGDTSKIASALSDDFGRIKLVAKGARQLLGQRFAALEPGNQVELLVYARPGRDLWTLAEVQLLRSALLSRGAGLDKLTHLFAALELAERLLPEQEQLPSLAALYHDYLERWHGAPEAAMAGLFFGLELALAAELGVALDLAHCGDCGEDLGRRERAAFVPADGVLRCDRCGVAAGRWLDGPTLGRLRALAAGEATELRSDERSAIGRLLHDHLGFHLANYRVPRALYWLRDEAAHAGERA